MRVLRTIWFAWRQRRLNRSRVSAGAYIKGFGNIRLGQKCKIHDSASVDASRAGLVTMGDGVTVNRFAYIQADNGGVTLGARVEINNFSIVNGTGGVSIGDDTLIGPGVRIVSYTHQYAADELIRDQPSLGKPISIGRDVWIGANAVVLAGVTIGDGAVVAAGAVVNRDVAPSQVVAGVPAKRIKSRN